MGNNNYINKNIKSVTGQQLIDQGINTVAKISLWISQESIIKELFDYSEKLNYLWDWSETQYTFTSKGEMKTEISFIYYLKAKEVKEFKSQFPIHIVHFMRFDAFIPEIFDYYQKKVGVIKHRQTI
ncbi:MAG: hypothetical protein ACE5EE_04425 [Fidelibacterota bacterium]